MLRRTGLAAFFAAATTVMTASTGSTPAAASEVRAIWVTRWDYRSAREVRAIVRSSKLLGLNRIYFQVRGQADAYYRSRLEPWGEEIGGVDPGFDPLEVAVEAARSHGMEIHAWANVLAGWKGKRPPRSRRHIVHRHPEWFLLDRYGKRHVLAETYTLVNPCWPEVRRHIVAVMTDIAGRYSIDGLHLDYIRFVARDARARQAVPYDNHTLRQFRRLTGGFPVRHPERWDDFRRGAVDLLVRQISSAVRERRPGCVLSAAVVRDLDHGRVTYFQDARTWTANGWIDEIVPMNYDRDPTSFARHARNTVRLVGPGRVVCGVGAYLQPTGDALRRQIETSRSLSARGYAVFAYASFFPTPSRAADESVVRPGLRGELRAALRRANATAGNETSRRTLPFPAGTGATSSPRAVWTRLPASGTPAPCAPGRASGGGGWSGRAGRRRAGGR